MNLVSYIVRIYEKPSYAIVTHVFTGKTRDEAMSYFNAHLETDAFLNACVNGGNYNGIKCFATYAWYEGNSPAYA